MLSDRSRDFLKRVLHILALSSLAISQPLFEQLGQNPEFFIMRGGESTDVAGIIVLFSLVIPLTLVLLEWLLSKLFPDHVQDIHAAICFLIFLAFSSIALNRTWQLPWIVQILGALLI